MAHGRELMGGPLELAERVRSAVEQLDGLHVDGRED